MPNRSIKSKARGSSVQLVDCLSSLLALELLSPGPELYLISPWLSRVMLIDNRFGQFRVIGGEHNQSELSLADILLSLAKKGTRVYIMCRPDRHNDELLQTLSNKKNIALRRGETLHEKGLITHHFYLRGSMNFTYAGIKLNDESVELTTDPNEVSHAIAEARRRWEGLTN